MGVMIALAADRWVTGLDERERERSYLVQIVENLSADSAYLVQAVEQAESRRQFAVGVLDGGVDSLLAHPETFLEFAETLTWWVPIDFSRETWDDLVSSGGLSLIRDTETRLTLSQYYNNTEFLASIEASWEGQLLASAPFRYDLVSPLKRLQSVGALPAGAVTPTITEDDARRALQTLRDDASNAAGIGNIALIYSGQGEMYGELLLQASDLLALLRGAL